MYIPIEGGLFAPVFDPRLISRVSENVIIITAWGEPVVCLAGSYIVTYDEASNDYNGLEKGAYDSTYRIFDDNYLVRRK